VKIARSRVETDPPSDGIVNLMSPFFSRTDVMMMRFFRSAWSASS